MTSGTNTPKAPVSVVIPCFRCTATIERAVASVLAQTLPPAELILVDDHSEDGTLNTLEQVSERLGRHWVRVLALPANVGAASARNHGWEAASQEFVAFLDADDAWHPQKTELQSAYLSRHPDVALCGRTHTPVSATGDMADGSGLRGRRASRLELLLANQFTPSAVMLRRSLPLRFLEGQRHMEDHFLWLRLGLAGHRIDLIDFPLAYSFKAPYGDSGLSAQMLAMARADFDNYWRLRQEGLVSLPAATVLCAYSALKSMRRLTLNAFRKRANRP